MLYPAQVLVRTVQNKEGVKGRYWFMDADVKDGALTGKTGKTILTVLRHLGRLQEVCCNSGLSQLCGSDHCMHVSGSRSMREGWPRGHSKRAV